ncbi:MAG: glycosyltransferase family 9 protein [Dongiaceae bacterium]
MENILIIKHGALGDFVQSLGAMASIRLHHPKAKITLLTTKPMESLASACPYIDEVWIDARAKIFQPLRWWPLLKKLRSAKWKRVYDLQTSKRSSFYFHLLPNPKPEWSGIAKGCSHPQLGAARHSMHTLDRLHDQLRLAGIATVPPPDLSWLKADIAHFALKPPYILLVPGGSSHRPEKRWPAEYYGELAKILSGQGYTMALLGGQDDQEAIDTIIRIAPKARSLAGRTSYAQLAELGRNAKAALGNDTGPLHLLSLAGCSTIALFSRASDPARCGQRGRRVEIFRENNLKDLAVARVIKKLQELLA